MSHLYRAHNERQQQWQQRQQERQQQKQQRQQQQQQRETYSRRNLLHQQYSSFLPRSSRRDVFSEQTCDDSFGYPFARAANDRETFEAYHHNHNSTSNNRYDPSDSVTSEDDPYGGRRRHRDLGMTLHSENIVDMSMSMSMNSQPYGYEDEYSDDMLSFSDAETLIASSSNHSSSIQTSSIYLEDSVATTSRSKRPLGNLLPPEPEQARAQQQRQRDHSSFLYQNDAFEEEEEQEVDFTRNHSHPMQQADASESVASFNDDDDDDVDVDQDNGDNHLDLELQEFRDYEERVLVGPLPSEESKPDSKLLILMAGMALCLLLMVVAFTVTWLVLGSKLEKELAARPTATPTPLPSIIMTPPQQPTFTGMPVAPFLATPAPTTAPVTGGSLSGSENLHNPVQQWAEQFLPNRTLQLILLQQQQQQQQSSSDGTITLSPQYRAYEWIQSDPYFNATMLPQITYNLTQAEVEAKQRNRFGLTTVFHSLGGGWQGWLSNEDECQWPYYSCGTTTTTSAATSAVPPPTAPNMRQRRHLTPGQGSGAGRGASLELRNLRVTGILPAEVSLLSSLNVLAIYDDDDSSMYGGSNNNVTGLFGSLPTELGLLADLRVLDLHGHTLVGMIPSQLGRLDKLQELYLHDNSFQGTVPPELCRLVSQGTLRTMTVDCESVVCHCGCTCPTGGTSDSHHNNVFDHSTTTTTDTAVPSVTVVSTSSDTTTTFTPVTSAPSSMLGGGGALIPSASTGATNAPSAIETNNNVPSSPLQSTAVPMPMVTSAPSSDESILPPPMPPDSSVNSSYVPQPTSTEAPSMTQTLVGSLNQTGP